jgi:SAM-dependent methyltransferase
MTSDLTSCLCETCDPLRYEDPAWMRFHASIEPYSVDKHLFKHTNGGHVLRKGWEWTHCVYGLDQLGCLHPNNTALGVGAGRECLIFYFAERLRSVVALDLYGNELWSSSGGKEASAEVIEDPQRFCPVPVPLHKLRFVNGDGTDLKFQDNTFDFCWSMSSIEHFGGHEAAARSMQEMARVTKPGGIIAVATEYLLLEEYSHPEYFTRSEVSKYLINAAPNLRLVGDVCWDTLPDEYLIDSIVFPGGIERHRRHVVLNDGSVQWTSILLFFRKFS